MPLAPSTKLAPNFTAHELGVDVADATDLIVLNAEQTAAWLQAARGILGVPLIVTSGFRTVAANDAAGGAADSDHLVALAADWKAQGLTPFAVYQRLTAAQQAGQLPPFDQLIFYAADDHVHVGLGTRMRGEILLRTTEGSYVQLAGAWVNQIRGYL